MRCITGLLFIGNKSCPGESVSLWNRSFVVRILASVLF